LKEGERITGIEMVDDDWWMGENSKGERGLFPSNYVELVEGGALQETHHTSQAVADEPPPPPAPPAQTSGGGQTATAEYDYEAAEENELSFPEGAKITNVVSVHLSIADFHSRRLLTYGCRNSRMRTGGLVNTMVKLACSPRIMCNWTSELRPASTGYKECRRSILYHVVYRKRTECTQKWLRLLCFPLCLSVSLGATWWHSSLVLTISPDLSNTAIRFSWLDFSWYPPCYLMSFVDCLNNEQVSSSQTLQYRHAEPCAFIMWPPGTLWCCAATPIYLSCAISNYQRKLPALAFPSSDHSECLPSYGSLSTVFNSS